MKSILGEQNALTPLEEVKAIFVIYIESFNIQQFSRSIEAANNHELISSQFDYFQFRSSNSYLVKIVNSIMVSIRIVHCGVKVIVNYTQINGARSGTRYHVGDISQLYYLPIRLVLSVGSLYWAWNNKQQLQQ
ncbi:Hypothetical_protein [Hexamita inflata]|uniref:Hypothetical_protein n=1 Tax=Hexamita inflata TaxID=28002 RepID=A0AA86Q5H2_9EUKA|nr:Hypothetical protein HINF_LOCUS38531 [Hexamita inflata]